MNCELCSKELQSDNYSIESQLQILMDWLCASTCIYWRFADIPHAPPKGCEQYGVLSLDSSEYKVQPTKSNVVYQRDVGTECPETKICVLLEATETLQLNLSVYRNSGDTTGCELIENTSPPRSAFDVLRFIRARTYVDQDELKEIGVSFNRGTDLAISTVQEENEAGKLCGTHAEMSLAVDVCTTSSYPTEQKLFHWCAYDCDGKPMCAEPQDECEE